MRERRSARWTGPALAGRAACLVVTPIRESVWSP
jgi:hypothetical protein